MFKPFHIFNTLGLFALTGLPLHAVQGTSAWAVYWDAGTTEKAYAQYGHKLDVIRIFGIHFDESGKLIPASPWVNDIRKSWGAIKGQKPKRFLVTVVNDVVSPTAGRQKDPAIVKQVLATPESRQAHIAQIGELSAAFDGVEIDYERVPAQDRDTFTLFIQELAAELHSRKKWLSVVVEPKTEEVTFDGPGSADWEKLAAAADELTIMAYFKHHGGGPAGPLAPADWVYQIAQFALTRVPAEKITIALSGDAIEWKNPGEGSQLSWLAAHRKQTATSARLETPGPDRSPRFYYVENGTRYEVWTENRESLLEKIERVKRCGILSVSIWRLDSGGDSFWKKFVQRGTLRNK